MTDQPMTLAHAADKLERVAVGLSDETMTAVGLLIAHARATAAPGDLAALARTADAIGWRHPATETEHDAFIIREGLRAHRCAPAVEVATGDVAPMSPDDECTCGHDYATHVVNEGACLHAKVCACAGFDLAPPAPAAPQASEGAPVIAPDRPVRFDTSRQGDGGRFRHVAIGTVRVRPGDDRWIVLDTYDETGAEMSPEEARDLAATLTTAADLPAVPLPARPLAVGDTVESTDQLGRLGLGAVVRSDGGMRVRYERLHDDHWYCTGDTRRKDPTEVLRYGAHVVELPDEPARADA